jgi:predicted nucleotidyltransferase
MVRNTEIELLKYIMLEPGIHVRELSRKLKLGIPSIKYGLEKLKKLKIVTTTIEGRNLKYFVNYNNELTTRYIYNVENHRLQEFPTKVRTAIYDYLKILETKPLMTIIFGSYARGDKNPKSDIDILLIFTDKIDKNIEDKTDIINSRYGIIISPIYMKWSEFNNKFHNNKDLFMKQVKEHKIIFQGLEWWLMLENENA